MVKLCVTSAAIALLALGVLANLPRVDCPGVTKTNFERVEKGMSMEQVQAILGTRPFRGGTFKSGGIASTTEIWFGDDGAQAKIEFAFDYFQGSEEGVSGMVWCDSSETTIERIRRWLHIPKN